MALKSLIVTLDTNTAAVSDSIDMKDAVIGAVIQAVAVSGSHSAHVVTVKFSMDNATWVTDPFAFTSTIAQLASVGVSAIYPTGIFRWMRLEVTTNEGNPSETDFHIGIK